MEIDAIYHSLSFLHATAATPLQDTCSHEEARCSCNTSPTRFWFSTLIYARCHNFNQVMPLLSVIPWLMMAIQYLQQMHALPFFLKPTPDLVGSYAIVKHRLKNISLTWQHKQTITETLSLCIRLRKHEAISCVHLFCSMYLQRYTSQLYQ